MRISTLVSLQKKLLSFSFFISRRQWMVWISMRINNGRPVREKRFKIDENFSEMRSWNDAFKLQCHSSSLNNIFNKKVLKNFSLQKYFHFLFKKDYLWLVQRARIWNQILFWLSSILTHGLWFKISASNSHSFSDENLKGLWLKISASNSHSFGDENLKCLWFKISASNSHSFGDENLEGENRENHSKCGRAQHRRRQAHLCITALKGHNIQVDEQVDK
jgi:hypothetical protein